MRKVLASIIAALLFFSVLPGLTLRMGIEGPSILGLSFEMGSGLCFGFGAIPPITIFGPAGPWSFSFTGGYSYSLIILHKDRMEVSALMRGCLGAIISESFSLAAVLGVLLETKWNISPGLKAGVQLGLNLNMVQRITSPETNFVPMGQVGLVIDF